MASEEKSSRYPKASDVTEADLAPQKMGDNTLQGNDQLNVRNQRHGGRVVVGHLRHRVR